MSTNRSNSSTSSGHLSKKLNRAPVSLEVMLDKISHLYQNINQSADGPTQVDIDLLKKYTMQWYDGLVEWSGSPLQHGTSSLHTTNHAEVQEQSSNETAPAPEPPPQVYQEISAPVPPPAAAVISPVESQPEESKIELEAPAEKAAEQTPVGEEERSLNDRFNQGGADLASTLSARGGGDPAADLRKLIDVNERFLFIAELFEGDSETYNSVIRRLNDMGTMAAAEAYLHTEVSGRFNWDPEDNAVRHFFDILEQKLA